MQFASYPLSGGTVAVERCDRRVDDRLFLRTHFGNSGCIKQNLFGCKLTLSVLFCWNIKFICIDIRILEECPCCNKAKQTFLCGLARGKLLLKTPTRKVANELALAVAS